MGSYHGSLAARNTSKTRRHHHQTASLTKASPRQDIRNSSSPIVKIRRNRTRHHAVMTLRHLRFASKLRFERRNHDAGDLVRKAISSFRRGRAYWSSKQLAALEQWHEWLPHWEQQYLHPTYIREGLRLLGEMFFLGRLSRCRFDWQAGLFKCTRCYGMTLIPARGSRNWTAMRIDPHPDDGKDVVLRDALIMTLLHECMHAFLDIWACDGSRCKNKRCKAMHTFGIGKQGHGYLWFQLASHVYATAHNLLGIDTVDAADDIWDSMKHEWKGEGIVPGWRHVRGCHRRYRFRIFAFIREHKDKTWVPPT